MIRFRDYPQRGYWPIHLSLAGMRAIAPLPRAVQRFVGRRIGAIEYKLRHRGRRIAERNLAICFPELDDRDRQRLLRKHFEALGHYVVELSIAWWCRDRRLRALGRLDGLEHLQRAMAGGRGVVLLTGHFTTSEIAGHILALHLPQLAAFYKPHPIAVIDEILRRGREKRMTTLAHTRMRAMMRSIRGGSILWYAPDLETSGPTALVPFFSEPAISSTAISGVARLSGAPVVPFFPSRLADGSGYRLTFGPALEDFPGESPESDTRRFHDLLERQIREDPAEYFWLNPKFADRPPDLANAYAGLRLGAGRRRSKAGGRAR